MEAAIPIGVFWDIENCPVPRDKSAISLVAKIRNCFFKGHTEIDFICVCDATKQNNEVLTDLNYAQVTVVHVPSVSKNTSDDKLRQCLQRFVSRNQAPATVILITGDINFAPDLSDLRYRHHFFTILLHNKMAVSALLSVAENIFCFEDFTNDIDAKLMPRENQQDMLVLNLPLVSSAMQDMRVRKRLKHLSSSCRGHILELHRDKAIIRFHNRSTAIRAQKRMNGEDVYGRMITTQILNPSPSPPVLLPPTSSAARTNHSCHAKSPSTIATNAVAYNAIPPTKTMPKFDTMHAQPSTSLFRRENDRATASMQLHFGKASSSSPLLSRLDLHSTDADSLERNLDSALYLASRKSSNTNTLLQHSSSMGSILNDKFTCEQIEKRFLSESEKDSDSSPADNGVSNIRESEDNMWGSVLDKMNEKCVPDKVVDYVNYDEKKGGVSEDNVEGLGLAYSDFLMVAFSQSFLNKMALVSSQKLHGEFVGGDAKIGSSNDFYEKNQCHIF